MYDDLKGKTAIVTGAGKKTGIGYGIASKLAQCGANIIVADLGSIGKKGEAVPLGTDEGMKDVADTLKREFKVDSIPVQVDVTSTDSINAMVETVKKSFERVDILCNNAGASFGVPNSFMSYKEDDWMRTVDVNLLSVFRVTRAVVPLMLGKPGAIINTASRAGKVPPLLNSAYATAKAGVIMLTKTMAKEIAGLGIRVNAICPGQIMTDLEKWRFGLEAKFFNSTIEEREKEMCKTIPLGYIGMPADTGSVVAFLASEESRYITGQAINVDGGQCMEL
ncbi:MAG: SDR family oxidoreductase [Spirochaetes bacterium]|nr:SDR family oxidoreductase [Spirochaetota bacterium]